MKYCLSILSLAAVLALNAQSGFYGKRVVVDVSGLGRIPVWNNINSTNTTAFSPGFSLGLSGAVANTISIGAEFSTQYNAFDSEKYLSYVIQQSQTITYNDQIRYRATSVLLRVEFHKNNMAPYGISHVVAIGPTFSHCVDKDYKYNVVSTGYYDDTYQQQDFDAKHTGLTLMYAFNGRTALTESLWLNFGIRTTLNIPITSDNYYGTTRGEVQHAIRESQLRNVFSAKLGLSYAF